jgi:hypothetical protein
MNITIARGTVEDGISDVAWCDVFGNVSDFTPYHEVGHTVDQAFNYVKQTAIQWTHAPLRLDERGEPILSLITNGPDFEVVGQEVIHDHRMKRFGAYKNVGSTEYMCLICEKSGSIHDLAEMPCESE